MRGWLPVNSRARCSVWQRVAGRVGLSGYLRNSVSQPMFDEARVDKACVKTDCVAFVGSGYAGTVREVRLCCIVSARNVWMGSRLLAVLESCMCWQWGLYILCMYVCSFFLWVRCPVLGKKKQHVPLICHTCHKSMTLRTMGISPSVARSNSA